MKRKHLVLITLTLFFACTHVKESDRSIDIWLRQYDLKMDNFTDSTSMRAFELWSYTLPIDKNDSTLKRVPSPDSSFSLLTNFKEKRINEGPIDFHFLDNNTGTLYLGFEVLEEYADDIIDCHWIDGKSIEILLKDSTGFFELTKYKMQIDSVWTYTTRQK
jgi:hypothetical protein